MATQEKGSHFSLVIENISLPEEVEKALDERTKLGVMSDKMGTYMQYQAGQAMTEAAKNPNGNNDQPKKIAKIKIITKSEKNANFT